MSRPRRLVLAGPLEIEAVDEVVEPRDDLADVAGVHRAPRFPAPPGGGAARAAWRGPDSAPGCCPLPRRSSGLLCDLLEQLLDFFVDLELRQDRALLGDVDCVRASCDRRTGSRPRRRSPGGRARASVSRLMSCCSASTPAERCRQAAGLECQAGLLELARLDDCRSAPFSSSAWTSCCVPRRVRPGRPPCRISIGVALCPGRSSGIFRPRFSRSPRGLPCGSLRTA